MSKSLITVKTQLLALLDAAACRHSRRDVDSVEATDDFPEGTKNSLDTHPDTAVVNHSRREILRMLYMYISINFLSPFRGLDDKLKSTSDTTSQFFFFLPSILRQGTFIGK